MRPQVFFRAASSAFQRAVLSNGYSKAKSRGQAYSTYLIGAALCCFATSASATEDQNDPSTVRKVYRRSEIMKHTKPETGVWVTFEDGVYDITSFIVNHPGGTQKILLAAGGSVEPFWNIYRQHLNSNLARKALEQLRIGDLHPDDYKEERAKLSAASSGDANDPYSRDPEVSPIHVFHQRKPVNAEAPAVILADSWITSEEFWFKRNHHPVPHVPDSEYVLTVSGLGVEGGKVSFSLDDLKNKFKKYTVVSTIQCGGNRRREMNSVALTAGSPWDTSAISNAKWGGARLRDVLKAACGPDADEERLVDLGVRHVQFAAAEGLEASIPLHKAVSLGGDVILAYEMNDKPVPPSHGHPVRAIVPGHVGVRNVKWLSSVTLSSEEAEGPWQRGMAYKGFSPSRKTLDGIEVEKIPSLQEQPVQSAILTPRSSTRSYDEPVDLHPGHNVIQGYAYSGGGRGIVRVDVSCDGGETWREATLRQGSDQPLDRAWAWTFWDCVVEIPEDAVNSQLQLICKATDASYNVQPDTVKGIWNLRGINNNAWHRVNVRVVPEPAADDIGDDYDDDE